MDDYAHVRVVCTHKQKTRLQGRRTVVVDADRWQGQWVEFDPARAGGGVIRLDRWRRTASRAGLHVFDLTCRACRLGTPVNGELLGQVLDGAVRIGLGWHPPTGRHIVDLGYVLDAIEHVR